MGSQNNVYYWVKKGTKPGTTPIRLNPELGYIIGVLLSDAKKNIKAILKVKDKDYAEEYLKALNKVTGVNYSSGENEQYYVVHVHGSALRYIYRSELWKVIRYVYSREFLQGLYDGDGSVGVRASKEFKVAIDLTNSNLDLLDFVQKILKQKYSIRTARNIHRKDGEQVSIRGKLSTVRKTEILSIYRKDDLIKFCENIRFRIKRKQEKLIDALNILEKYGWSEKAVEEWKKRYQKVNNEWIKKNLNLYNKQNTKIEK